MRDWAQIKKVCSIAIIVSVQTLTDDIIGVEPSPSVEYVDACRYRARASSSSSSTGSWEEYFDAVEYQPASHSPRPFNVIPPTTALSSPLNASAPEFIPNPPEVPVAKEWEIEPGFFTPSRSSPFSTFLPHSKTDRTIRNGRHQE